MTLIQQLQERVEWAVGVLLDPSTPDEVLPALRGDIRIRQRQLRLLEECAR